MLDCLSGTAAIVMSDERQPGTGWRKDQEWREVLPTQSGKQKGITKRKTQRHPGAHD